MPENLSLRGPVYTFVVYGQHEAKQLGLIDSWEKEGTHAPVSTVFEHREGKLLAEWLVNVPDALLVKTGRYQITIYRPKRVVKDVDMPEGEEEEPERFEEWTPEREQVNADDAPANGKRVFYTRALPPETVGSTVNAGKYCEGAEGIPLNGDVYDDVKTACEDSLRRRGVLKAGFQNPNDFLFEKHGSFSRSEFFSLVKWAKHMKESNPKEFGIPFIAEQLEISTANARLIHDAACRPDPSTVPARGQLVEGFDTL